MVEVKRHVECKGVLFLNKIGWIKDRLGQETLAKAIALLPERVKQHVVHPLASNYYDFKEVELLLAAVLQVHFSGDEIAFKRALIESGDYAAKTNLTGVYRVLLKFFTSPDRVMSELNRLASVYYRNITFEIDRSQIEQQKVTVKGFGQNLHEVRYLNAIAAGWIEHAMKMAGAKKVSAIEENLAQGKFSGNPLVFHVEWQV